MRRTITYQGNSFRTLSEPLVATVNGEAREHCTSLLPCSADGKVKIVGVTGHGKQLTVLVEHQMDSRRRCKISVQRLVGLDKKDIQELERIARSG